jgi:dolichol-phosphate mannosyltransferase
MKIVAIAPMYNEGERTLEVVKRFPKNLVDEIVVVDDASTDGTARKVAETGATVLSLSKRSGCGIAIRHGLDYGLKKDCNVFIILAGNGKDDPNQIPRLLAPLQEGRADFVQGSRYLPGGEWSRMPFHRIWGTRVYSFLFSLLVGKRITDATNGFRAFRRSLLEDPRINLWQEWLDGYSVETYLFVQAIRLGYHVTETPVTKNYPNGKKGYTKVRPWVDWWNHFKPVPLLTLGLKK